MSAFIFTPIIGSDISEALLSECSKLFSTNYGVWSEGGPRPGASIKMPAEKLKKMIFAAPESTALATCTFGSVLIGHAFAAVWPYADGRAGWVTQLVVDKAFRRRYVATQLIQTFKRLELFRGITAFGIVSSQPASIAACIKFSHVQPGNIDINFIAGNALKILEATPVEYLKASNANLYGSAFDPSCDTGAVSSAFTQFYVDHKEPMKALSLFQADGRWCLGKLLDGYEYLAIVPVKDL